MNNPLASLRECIAPASRRRTGTVTSCANGRATVRWLSGGLEQVLCGIAVSPGDRVLVVGEAVATRLPVVPTSTVTIV